MKKGSGFEKFFKGKEKTGGAKKEAIRQEKREIRKEREEKIADAKRQKRAQYRAANNNEPPKYNLEPPTGRYQKKGTDQRSKPSFKVERKNDSSGERPARQEQPGRYKKEDNRYSSPRDRQFDPRAKRTDKPNDNRNGGGRDNRFEKRDTPGGGERKEGRFTPHKDNKPGGDRREGRFTPNKDRNFGGDRKEGRFTPGKGGKFGGDRKTPTDRPQRKEYGEAKPTKARSLGPAARLQPTTPKPLTDQMPLNKYIAHSGVCSRRDAVDLIKGGKVKVNGELILEPGYKVALTDDVKVGGKKMNPVKDFIYILLNKPKDYITTTEDPQERKTVLDLLQGAPDTRIYPVGRLDRNTSGVLLLTNDGDLSQKLTHPSNEIKKVYAVTLDKPLTRHHFEEILRGVQLEDGMAHVDTLAYADAKDHTQIGVELHSGRNRIVRRIFEHLGYDVKGLDRVIFAGLTKKNVNRGKWRFLTEKEVRDLKFFKKGR
jgi:23S rRNA pseudouridine2605 synthase